MHRRTKHAQYICMHACMCDSTLAVLMVLSSTRTVCMCVTSTVCMYVCVYVWQYLSCLNGFIQHTHSMYVCNKHSMYVGMYVMYVWQYLSCLDGFVWEVCGISDNEIALGVSLSGKCVCIHVYMYVCMCVNEYVCFQLWNCTWRKPVRKMFACACLCVYANYTLPGERVCMHVCVHV